MRRSPQTQPLSPFSFIATPKKIGGSVIVAQTPGPEQGLTFVTKRRVSAPRPLKGSRLGGSGSGVSGRSRQVSRSVNERQLIGLGILQDSPALNVSEPSTADDARGGNSRLKERKVHRGGARNSEGGKPARKENIGGQENHQVALSIPQQSTKRADRTSSPKSTHITFASPVKPLRSPPAPVLKKQKSRRLLKSKPVQGMTIALLTE